MKSRTEPIAARCSRRNFLRSTGLLAAGAALGGPAVVPETVFGATAPNSRITMAFIGVGRQTFGSNIPEFMAVPEELDYDTWLGPAPKAPYTLNRVHPRHDLKGRPGWMRRREYCGGLITNWGTHLNDVAQWGNGTERTGPVEVEDPMHYQVESVVQARRHLFLPGTASP